MKTHVLLTAILICFGISLIYGQTDSVKVIKLTPQVNSENRVTGNLNTGKVISDLSWAWKSSVACFPATQKSKFTGNHVLYSVIIPKYSTMEITVIPDDKNANFSLYAYEIGLTNNSIVPNLSSCVQCEAEFKWDYKKAGRTQDHTRTISNITSTNNSYKVIIGVVGAEGLNTGGYVLKYTIKSNQ